MNCLPVHQQSLSGRKQIPCTGGAGRCNVPELLRDLTSKRAESYRRLPKSLPFSLPAGNSKWGARSIWPCTDRVTRFAFWQHRGRRSGGLSSPACASPAAAAIKSHGQDRLTPPLRRYNSGTAGCPRGAIGSGAQGQSAPSQGASTGARCGTGHTGSRYRAGGSPRFRPGCRRQALRLDHSRP